MPDSEGSSRGELPGWSGLEQSQGICGKTGPKAWSQADPNTAIPWESQMSPWSSQGPLFILISSQEYSENNDQERAQGITVAHTAGERLEDYAWSLLEPLQGTFFVT